MKSPDEQQIIFYKTQKRFEKSPEIVWSLMWLDFSEKLMIDQWYFVVNCISIYAPTFKGQTFPLIW